MVVDRFFQCGSMNIPGKMDRTFSVNRIPAGRIGSAEKLCFQAHADDGLFGGHIGHTKCGLPCCTAGGTSFYRYVGDFSLFNFNGKFRSTKFFAI